MTELPDQAASRVRLATVRLSRRMRAQKSDDRVTDSQMTVLMHLAKHGSMTLSELAEAERISAPSMNRTVIWLSVTRSSDFCARMRRASRMVARRTWAAWSEIVVTIA